MQTAIFVLSGIILLGVGGVALLPEQFKVQRSTVIARPPSEVFALVSSLPHRQSWTAWGEQDPRATFSCEGTGVGSRMRWDGKKIGVGEVTITELKADRALTSTLRFEAPMHLTSTDTFSFDPLPNGQTLVTWTNVGKLAGAGKLFGLVIDRVVGKDYARGLERLKEILEH